MRISIMTRLFGFATLAMLLCQPAHANQIGLGIDWRSNIFVQEYWRDGVPYYSLANLTANPVAITVMPFGTDKGTVIAGPWQVPAHGSAQVNASALVGKGIVAFMADTKSIGLLLRPNMVDGKIRIYDGMNGSGGKHFDVWTEQDLLEFASGSDIELRLHVPANLGVLTISRKASTSGDVFSLPVDRVECSTLNMENTADAIKIDVHKPTAPVAEHLIKLYYKAPEVSATSQAMASFWVDLGPGGGYVICRGLIIQPGKK